MSPREHYFVKDWMSQRGLSISKDVSLKEAVQIMIREKTNGLVVTEDDKVVGIVSSWDLIRHVVPDYLEDEGGSLGSFEAEPEFAKRAQQVAEDKVEKLMTKNVHTVKPDDTLMEAATMLSEHGIRQLPVVDDNFKLIGYINRTDLKAAIGDVLDIINKK